jgi:hypothetical protein
MATRRKDVDALIARSREDFAAVEAAYQSALHDRAISAELRIDIKNLCGNLRSTLDYVARDIRETHCPSADPRTRFYFPIMSDATQYQNQMNNWYPGLNVAAPDLWNYLENVQPYHPSHSWLGTFNRVNNDNKHESLVEQTRAEAHRVNVSFGGGNVSWDPKAVKFGSGVFIGGVPVDPSTQMPVPDASQKVERVIWVDFQFEGIGESALGLLRQSLDGICTIATDIYGWV